MATEGVSLTDGGNLIAGTDFSKTASTILSGANKSGQFLAVTLVAGSSDRVVTVSQTANQRIVGIIQNAPANGQAAQVCFDGITKAVYGGTVTRGDLLEVTASGLLITSSTASHLTVAEAWESGAANEIHTVRVYPAPYLHP